MKRFVLSTVLLLASTAAFAQQNTAPTAPRQQEQPAPPTLVLGAARRFGRALGKSVDTPPNNVRVKLAEFTGHAVWSFGWLQDTPGFAITVDAATGRMVGFEVGGVDTIGQKAVEDILRSGQPLPVTEKQAGAAALAMLRHAVGMSGDWRVESVDLDPWGERAQEWGVGIGRYVEGKPCALDSAFVEVNPLDKSVRYFVLTDSGVRLPQTGPLISVDQARTIAAASWRQFGGPDDVSPETRADGLPVWTQLPAATPLCRLAYNFHFTIRQNGAVVAGYGAAIDAETGELWWLKIMTGGGAAKFTSRPVQTSARIALAAELARNKEAVPLARAIASGAPLKVVKPAAKARRFPYRAGSRTVHFAWGADRRALTWQEEAGKPAGVHLSPDEAARLEAWFKSRGNSTAETRHVTIHHRAEARPALGLGCLGEAHL